jgi:hypothetical protein
MISSVVLEFSLSRYFNWLYEIALLNWFEY